MPSLFERYAILIEDCIRRKVDWQVIGVGIDDDGVRELRNDLWTLSDNHRAGEGNGDETDEMGEDEET